MSKKINAPYKSLRTVRCDCGLPAVHQVPVNVGGYTQWLALCADCHAEHQAAERARRRVPSACAAAPQPA